MELQGHQEIVVDAVMNRHITDEEIHSASVPSDTLLVVSERGADRELTFAALMEEKREQFNSTDYMLLCASLCYYGTYFAGSYYGWTARVKAGALLTRI